MEETMKRVLIVSNATNGGGAEKASMDIFQSLATDYYDIFYCGLNSPSVRVNYENNDRIFELDRKWESGLLSTINSFYKFASLVKDLNPDVMVLNCELPELFAALLFKRNMKLVVVEHTTRPWFKRRTLGVGTRSILWLRRCSWVSVSEDNQRIWPTNSHASYIPNPIKASDSSHGSEPEDSDGVSKGQLIFIGRLLPSKRPDWVVRVGIKLNLQTNIFGVGPDLSKLRTMAERSKSKVNFLGFVENPWSEVARHSLVIVPSEFEGDGLVVLEAILNNYSVLLADNVDLRRFDLPESQYFRTEEELESKVLEWTSGSSDTFKAPAEIFARIQANRNVNLIAMKWSHLLGLQKKNKNYEELQ